MRPRVKVCCILTPEEAALAVDAGADAVGLVGPGLSGPEVRTEDEIARIAATVPPPVATFLLTRLADPSALAAQVRRCGTSVVQICDAVTPEAWSAVRAAAPSVKIIQVVHMSAADPMAEALAAAPHVDALLLDSGTPAGPNPVYGGTGHTHDWRLSRAIVAASPRPVWLAGGLRPENIVEAWETVRPFGLDLCSGVRSNGRLDPARVRAFLDTARTLG